MNISKANTSFFFQDPIWPRVTTLCARCNMCWRVHVVPPTPWLSCPWCFDIPEYLLKKVDPIPDFHPAHQPIWANLPHVPPRARLSDPDSQKK